MNKVVYYPLPINLGGSGENTRDRAFTALAPENPVVGDTITWDGTSWVTSSDLSDWIADMTELQEDLLQSNKDLQETLRKALIELKKIKFGLMVLTDQDLTEV